jgi:uncharacterized YccA/Bax inhibitor family protein
LERYGQLVTVAAHSLVVIVAVITSVVVDTDWAETMVAMKAPAMMEKRILLILIWGGVVGERVIGKGAEEQ